MRSPWCRDGGRGAGGGGGKGEEHVGGSGWDGDEMSEGRNERVGCGVMKKMGRGSDDILPVPAGASVSGWRGLPHAQMW